MSGTATRDSGKTSELRLKMRIVAEQALALAPDITLIFVTNLQSGPLTDLGPSGVLNTAQYYTRSTAEEIIRSLQDLGVTVQSFFTEVDFLRWAAADDRSSRSRHTVVFTTAEGGAGSGRRAMVPAVCNLLDLPCLNSGAHACSLARHKFHANAVLAKVGVRVPASWLFASGSWLCSDGPPLGSRVILKPTYESMCIGIGDDSIQVVDSHFSETVRGKSELFRQPVLVQEFISGEEAGVPIAHLGSTYALPVVAFRRANGDRYGDQPKTFADENIDHDTSHAMFEAEPTQYAAVQQAAVRAFDSLEMAGVGRIDLRIDPDGRPWVFDTNESPPPLQNTAYARAMEVLGFTFKEMLAVWLGACLLDRGIISGVGPE